MKTDNRHALRIASFTTIVVAAVATIRCGGSPASPTPTSPTAGAVAAVTLNATTLAVGGRALGTVNLAAPAPAGGSSVSLSSSDSSVAAVPAAIMVEAGATTGTMTVTAMSAGTTTIRASLNGSTAQSPMLTVLPAAPVSLSAISLSTSNVVGGDSVTGTVILTRGAPDGGAVVSLSGNDPVTVPPNALVAAGSTSATFSIRTRAVGGSIPATISASYAGVSASMVLTVTPPTTATARFGVTGPAETETCTLMNNGNTLDCTFNGSTSTAPGAIVAWDWSYSVATTFSQSTTGPVLTMPAVSCAFLPPPPLPPDTMWLTMTVRLKIHDNLGNVSAEAVDSGVRLMPQGSCGY
jgi:trimeric autotransporter adhesin